MGTNHEENKKKEDLFKDFADNMGKVMDMASKGAKELGKATGVVSEGIGATTKKAIKIGSDIAEKQRISNKNKEIDAKILEHKYNIGKYIYDNELDVDDGIVISTINTIDRLVDEITELEGKKDG